MAAEGVLHDLGVIPMTSLGLAGHGPRSARSLRRMLQNAALMKRQFGGDGRGHDNERVLRHIAKATVNPAITHGIAEHVGSLQPGRLADCVLWQPAMCGVRPELVVEGRRRGLGRLRRRQRDDDARRAACASGRSSARSAARPTGSRWRSSARPALDAELPTARERAVVRGCRELTAADMVRNTRRGAVRVDPRTLEVTLDGELVTRAAGGRGAAVGAATCWAERGRSGPREAAARDRRLRLVERDARGRQHVLAAAGRLARGLLHRGQALGRHRRGVLVLGQPLRGLGGRAPRRARPSCRPRSSGRSRRTARRRGCSVGTFFSGSPLEKIIPASLAPVMPKSAWRASPMPLTAQPSTETSIGSS